MFLSDDQFTGLIILAAIPSIMLANDLRLDSSFLKLLIVFVILFVSFFGAKVLNTEIDRFQDVWVEQFWIVCIILSLCITFGEIVLWSCNMRILDALEKIAGSVWWNRVEIPVLLAYSILSSYALEKKSE